MLYGNGECMYIEFKDLNCVFVNVENKLVFERI